MATPEAGQGEVPQGPHRRVPPEETLARLAPHLERMGITRVANVTGLDRVGVPVVTVVRPNARSLAVSQGKGLTLAAAKVSAIMEAVELHHAETVSGPLWWARPHEIGGERLFVDPLALPRSSARVYEAGPIAWIEGEDLGRGGRSWSRSPASAPTILHRRSGSVAGSPSRPAGSAPGMTVTRRCCMGWPS